MFLKMLLQLFLLEMAAVTAKLHDDPVADQILLFKEKTKHPIATMTTAAGAPIEQKEATVTLNERLIFNEYFMDSMAHFVRERIPERVVHAKGGGAFGYFEVTHNITDICKAKLFDKVGKKTPIAVRFSPVFVEHGGADTTREPRGFAIKFYTEDGNFDLVGLNLPMFAFKDPLLFPAFVRAQKRNPATNVPDPNMLWDFLTLHPETLHMFLMVFGDWGIPDGYRHMPGFGIHTFQVVNKAGVSYCVRFFFTPDAGIKHLSSKKGKKIAGCDPDYAIKDLYRAIGNGNFPSWTASIQVLSESDVKNAGFDVFDVTKVLPLDRYPLRPFGRLVLNRNPVNYFAEIEQLAFCPSNLVPGILGAPDKFFEGRRFSYRDAEHYRLGANFQNIAVNYPLRHPAFPYNRDGQGPVKLNQRDIPNYYPNSFNGPVPYKENNKVKLVEICEDQPDNFDQAHELYENKTPGEKKRLVENIVESLSKAAKFLQYRAVKIYGTIHPDLSDRIYQGLQMNGTNLSCYDFDCDD